MRSLKIACTFVLLMSSIALFGQTDTGKWSKWSWLMGEWVGDGEGQPGKGSGKFTFKPGLNDNVLERKSISSYPAANGRPAMVHEDLMIVYRDVTNNADKAIYFDNENHVINYVVQSTENTIVFTSEKLDGKPVFRLTYKLIEAGKISIKFEMSLDGINFRTYVEGTCTRLNQQDTGSDKSGN